MLPRPRSRPLAGPKPRAILSPPEGPFMLDLRFVMDNKERVEAGLRARGKPMGPAENALWEQDAQRRALIVRVEELRHRQRLCGEEIARKGKAKEDASALKAEMKGVAAEIKDLEEKLEAVEAVLRAVLLTLPNLPDESVPIGRDETGNVEVRRGGEAGNVPFAPRTDWENGPALGILHFERAARMSGARFAVLLDDGARLERAL